MLAKDGLYLITDEKEVGYLTGYQTPDGYAVFDGEKNCSLSIRAISMR